MFKKFSDNAARRMLTRTMQGCTLLTLVVALLSACSPKAEGPLMCGTIEPMSPDLDIAVSYLPDGNLFEAQMLDPEVDSLGNYTFDMDLPEATTDVEVMIGQSLFAAHLEKGKTVRLDFKQQPDGSYTCTFGGDNADVSEALAASAQANDLFSMQDMTNAQSREHAQALTDKAVELAAAIKDTKLRDYYTQLFKARHTGTLLRLMGDVENEPDRPAGDEAQAKELLATIDPNSELDYLASNSILWLMAQVKGNQPAYKGDYSAYCMEQMDLVDSLITNQHFRKQMAYSIANTFFAYGDHETGKEAFWARYKEFAKDYPQYIEAFEGEYNKVVQSMDGQPVPDITLTTPDGKQVSIKSLQGKYTYIDVWATWCGPCCKEIPFVEKLVEQMKGNPKLQFVSFSVDSDRDAWLTKINADKPAWPQYILDAEQNKKLSDALTITGIPRFFVLGPDGTIVNQDAKRPSDPELVPYLEELTK